MSQFSASSLLGRFTRRRFVQGLTVGGAFAALGGPSLSLAEQQRLRTGPKVLTGTRFDLSYSPTPVNFTGADRFATAINGSVPAPVLRWKEGDTVSLKVTNNLAEDASVHWHGIILPSRMDGVPHVSDGFGGIKPGESFHYRFPVTQSGTYWYHSHSNNQFHHEHDTVDGEQSPQYPALFAVLYLNLAATIVHFSVLLVFLE